MTFRDDLDAAHARIESLERENARLVDEIERLKTGPTTPPPSKNRVFKIDADNKVARRRRDYVDASVMLIAGVAMVLALARCQMT